jgi:hypothetical protein
VEYLEAVFEWAIERSGEEPACGAVLAKQATVGLTSRFQRAALLLLIL